MTPLILLILAAMWAAVLLPPYLRDRNETKAAGSGQGGVRNRIEALTSSFSGGGRSYLPVGSSGQSASQVPLPPGARQAVAAPAAERIPVSSAVQVLDDEGRPARSADVPRLRPVGEPAAVEVADPEPEAAPSPAPRRPGSGSAFARRRRRDVLHTLMGIAGVTLVAALGLGGGPLLYLHLLADVALIGFVYLLVQRRKVSAEQEMKVAFLPHGGTGASATALLADGGGWNPGHSV
ncbi:MAG: hypothetical protein AAGK32_20055, partial [Actinomycetota bacterium]